MFRPTVGFYVNSKPRGRSRVRDARFYDRLCQLGWLEAIEADRKKSARVQKMNQKESLALANQMKQERRALRIEVRKLPKPFGKLAVAAILDRNPDCIHTMQIGWLLQWIDRMGAERIEKLLMECGCVWSDQVYSPTYKADAVTPYQRLMLIEKLRDERITPYSEYLEKLREDDTHGTGD